MKNTKIPMKPCIILGNADCIALAIVPFIIVDAMKYPDIIIAIEVRQATTVFSDMNFDFEL